MSQNNDRIKKESRKIEGNPIKPPLGPQLVKKFDDLAATHVPSSKVSETIAGHKPQEEITEILPGVRPIWASELKQMDIPPPSWIVDQFVSDSGISLISSKPGTFKTMLAIEIAKCIAQGEPLFGVFETKQTKVLVLDEESGNGRLKKRQAILGADEAGMATLSFADIKMSQKYADAIIGYCNDNGIGLVIFDSLTRFHVAQENASQEMSEVLSYFHLITKAGIAVLIIHHDPKSGYEKPDSSNTLRGSSDILAISDVHIVLQGDKYTKNKITVKQLKNRDDEPMSDVVLLVKHNQDKTRLWFEYVGEAPKPKSSEEITDEAIMAYINEHGYSSKEDIVAAFSGAAGQTKVASRLNELATTHELSLTIVAHGKKYFDLPKELDNE
jgi:hypothetical protein